MRCGQFYILRPTFGGREPNFKSRSKYNILLGTMIPRSGGDYAYIGVAFGPLPAFLYLWMALLILVPTGNAITALTFAQYLLQPFWPTCDAPIESVRLFAAVITCNQSDFFYQLHLFSPFGMRKRDMTGSVQL